MATGFVLPAIFVAIGLLNVITGQVYWPADRVQGNVLDGLFNRYTDGWRVWGCAIGKWGIASALFSWYALANFARTEHRAQLALGLSLAMMFAGIVSFCVGFFR